MRETWASKGERFDQGYERFREMLGALQTLSQIAAAVSGSTVLSGLMIVVSDSVAAEGFTTQ